MAYLIIVAGTISLVLLFLLWNYSYWYRRGILQGNPLKLLGDMNEVMITFTPYWQLYLALSRKFAKKPFYGAYSLGQRRLFIQDSEMVKDILTSKFSSFSENGFALDEEVEPIIGRDPFFQKGGEKWKERRTNFSAIMTPNRLRTAILPDIVAVSEEGINYLKRQNHESGKGDGTNVKNFSVRYMTNILVRVSLSLDAECFKEEKSVFLHQAEHLFTTGIASGIATFFTFIVPQLGAFLRMSALSKETRDFFDQFIQQQKRYRDEKGIQRNDILEFMTKRANDIKTHKNEEEVVTEKTVDVDLEVISVIIMFFLEGFETSSTTLTGTLASLAAHEEVQETLRQEVLKACPRGQDITEEAINSVPMLSNCILETLRLYPPAFIIQRVVTEDVTLQAKTGEEIHLKKGEYLNIPLITLHRDPEYFPDPEKFDPNRFEDEDRKRYHYGFGDGPRQCPGQKFANLAIKVMVAAILREFKVELSPKTKYPLEPVNNPLIFALSDVGLRFVPL